MDVSTAAAISLTREDLYKRVWATPMQKLAAEFGLSDVGLAKICKKHKIPRPSCGYWAKLANGKEVLRWPLPPIKDPSLAIVHFGQPPQIAKPAEVKSARPQAKPPEIKLATDPEIAELIAQELLPENRIECVSDLRGADRLVAATRDSLSHRDPDKYGRVSRHYDFADACFEVAVSKENIQRALLLLQSLAKAFKTRGYGLAVDSERRYAKVQVLEGKFRISVWEPSNRKTRELTKDEKLHKERFGWTIAVSTTTFRAEVWSCT